MTAFPATDSGNPIVNATGRYLQEREQRPSSFAAVTVTSVTPDTIVQGTTNQATTIAGTGFLASPVVTVSGTGVTVSSVVSVSATSITCNLTTTGGATVSNRSLTVTNAGAVDAHDADTKTAAFAVTASG